jgi:hypothetical protein
MGIGAASLAAASGANASATATPAAAAMQGDGCTFNRADLDVVVQEIELDSLHDLVARLVDQGECPACGFLGLDVRLRGVEPFPEPLTQDALLFTKFSAQEFKGVDRSVLSPQDPMPIDETTWTIPSLRLDFDVLEEIQLETVQELVARLGDLVGCSGCGMNGFDLHFHGFGPHPDPWTIDRQIFAFDPREMSGVVDYASFGVSEVVGFSR